MRPRPFVPFFVRENSQNHGCIRKQHDRKGLDQLGSSLINRVNRRHAMAEYSWDHVHIKTYDVTSSAKWLQDKLGAKPMHGTEITPARADMMLGGVRVLFT